MKSYPFLPAELGSSETAETRCGANIDAYFHRVTKPVARTVFGRASISGCLAVGRHSYTLGNVHYRLRYKRDAYVHVRTQTNAHSSCCGAAA